MNMIVFQSGCTPQRNWQSFKSRPMPYGTIFHAALTKPIPGIIYYPDRSCKHLVYLFKIFSNLCEHVWYFSAKKEGHQEKPDVPPKLCMIPRLCRVSPFITCTIRQVGYLLAASLLPTSQSGRPAIHSKSFSGIPIYKCGFKKTYHEHGRATNLYLRL